MPATITGLIPLLFEAMDEVSRELVGFIPAARRDSSAERAALNQTVTSFTTPAATASDTTPGVTAPNDGDQVIDTRTMTITKSRGVPVRWNGEQTMALNSPGGPGRANILRDQFSQAMRTLTNEIEGDLAALYTFGSRAFGTAATTPFATNLGDPAQLKKLLDDNGAPGSNRSLIINTSAGAALRTLAQLTKVNEAGTDSIQKQGILINLAGFNIRESAAIKTPASGTGAAYTSNAAGYAISATVITLITGTGTVLAGDVVTFAGDANKYVVAVGASAAGPITLALPGLRKALAASAVAMTIVAQSARNMAFPANAMALATRAPALPTEGDMADDRTLLTDPRSGLTYEVSLYRQYRQVRYEIAMAWGVQNFKSEHTSILLGENA